MAVDVQYHVKRLDTLRRLRYNWDSHWEETAKRLIPAHVSTFFSRGRNWTQGEKNTTTSMYDATGALALGRFQSVIESLATPRQSMWHRIVPQEDALRKNRRVMLYLENLNKLLFRERYRPSANFTPQWQKTLNSYGAYGNGVMWVDQNDNPNVGGLRYRNLHLGGCYFAENHQGVVDTMYREFTMKPRQIVQMFQHDGNIPKSVVEAVANANRMDDDFDIIHAVYPRMDSSGIGPETMPWASVYIFKKEQHVLREGGYVSLPAIIARYMQYAGEDYGRGPAQMVLPSLKLLDEQKKTVIKQGNRVVDPVLLTHDDGMIGVFSLRPGAINAGGVSADGRPLVHTLPTGDLAVADKMMEMERETINDAFLISLFQILVDTPRMTATEAIERAREKGMLIAPTAGRLQDETLSPMIEREIDVLAAQGRFPEPPPELIEAGGGYDVEYESPMARLARAESASGFARSLEMVTNVASVTQDIGLFDHFNFDHAVPELNEINGVPVSWTSSPEEVAAKRKARQEQMQTAQMVENAAGLASALKAGADVGATEGGGKARR